jgi:hypothetical protein
LLLPAALEAEPPRRVAIDPEVRAAPDINAPVLLTMPPGTPVRFLVRHGEWLGTLLEERLVWVRIKRAKGGPSARARRTNLHKLAPESDLSPGDRVVVKALTRLRERPVGDAAGDGELGTGMELQVHASSAQGKWLLVEDPDGKLGWVRRKAVDRLDDSVQPGQQAVIAMPGYLRSRATSHGRPLARLSTGERLRVTESHRTWAQVATQDGTRGWYPIERLRRTPSNVATETGEQMTKWQAGVRVRLNRTLDLRAGPGPRQPATFSLDEGSQVSLLRVSGDKKECWLLAIHEDGRWGWLDASQATPVEIGEAVVVAERDGLLDGGRFGGEGEMGQDNGTGMGRGRGPPVGLALRLRTIFPIGGDSQDPRYEASAGISLRTPIGAGFGLGLNGFFSATRSTGGGGRQQQPMAPDGQAPPTVEGESMRLALDLNYRLAEDWRVATSGGYAFNVASSVEPVRKMLRSRTGPFTRVSLSGRLTDIWSVSVAGNFSHSRDFTGMFSDIYGGEVLTALMLTERVRGTLSGGVENSIDSRGMDTLSLNARASVTIALTSWLLTTITGQHIGNDGSPVQVGSLSFTAFLARHFSLQLSSTVERSSENDATQWSITTGSEVRF